MAPEIQPPAPRTCVLCQVRFPDYEQQKSHFGSDWHRYNLKRRVAELPSVTAENFVLRVQQQREKTAAAQGSAGTDLTCEACRKTYASRNAFENHLASRRHQATVAKQPAETTRETTRETPKEARRNWRAEFATAKTEEEMMQLYEAKAAVAPRLDALDCLFCPHRAQCLNTNLSHMSKKHSFFIPYPQNVVDLTAFLEYLGEKVSVGNVCLLCNGRGRQLHSLEAVRKHMESLGHARLDDSDEAAAEYAEFYDFGAAADGDADGWEDVSDASDFSDASYASEPAAVVLPYTQELVLPSGQKLGNRKFSRYYRQSLHERPQRESAMIRRLMDDYQALGQVRPVFSREVRTNIMLERQRRAREIHRVLAVSMRANNQAHARPQVMF